MSRAEAELTARQNAMSGYYHHSYDMERLRLKAFLEGRILPHELADSQFQFYEYLLAPDRFRASKNILICSITLVCRAAVDYGVDAELSFSLSDYYINEVEKVTTLTQLGQLAKDLYLHYYALVQKEKELEHSLPVVRSIRYIKRNLHERLLVKDVAAALDLHPVYLSSLFKKDVGMDMARYIREEKLKEAKTLLLHTNHPISEISDMLGYSSPAYFATDFKKHYGCSPSRYCKDK